MVQPTVVLTAAFPAIAREILSGRCEIIEHPTEHHRTEEEMITILSDADAAIVLLSDPLSRRVLESNPNLRMIANYAVGYDNIDIAAAREHGVRVTNTPGVLTEATADLTMALILAVTRRVVEADQQVRATARCYWEPMAFLGASLQGKRLGIVGRGRIGAAVAHRAAAFGMEIAGVRRGDDLEPLLATSDVVTIHVPLSSVTHHLIDEKALGAMKRGSYLVNTSRGAIVDENALCDAVERGHLRGAALDVYEHEPFVNERLLTMPNVVLAPHIGSATEEARSDMGRIAATEVARFLAGMEAEHRVG